MKNFRRKLLLASSALALVMLLGCSSTEETSDSGSGSSEDYNQDCKDACLLAPPHQQEECLVACEV
jgi:hypothetical protein